MVDSPKLLEAKVVAEFGKAVKAGAVAPRAADGNPQRAPSRLSALGSLGAYRKLVRPRLKVVVITDGYHVQLECCRALQTLGHEVLAFPAEAPQAPPQGASGAPTHPKALEQPSARMARLAQVVAAFRPDMLLSINYVGFDRLGMLGELIETLRLPLAIWFVDSPLFFAMGYLPPTAQMTSTFVWDRTHAAFLERLGAPRVSHLPLGCELAAFAPDAAKGGPSGDGPAICAYPTSFVGSSLVPLGALWQGRLLPAEQDQARVMAQRLGADRAALHELVPSPTPPIDRQVLMAAWANCLASRAYRRALLAQLPQPALHIFGDAGWKDDLPTAQLHAPVAYGRALAQVYRRTRVNINATILQMPSAVNQRAFDVPAAGAFVVCDDQAEIHELFDAERGEVVVYRNGAELAELCDRYGKDAAGRAQVTARARARIEGAHTYVHRLQALIAQMRRNHGAAKFVARAPGRAGAGPESAAKEAR